MSTNLTTTLSFKDNKVSINRDQPTVMIGERINPTGRKKVMQALQENDFSVVRQDATSQVEAGARVLDVNAGVPGVDEVALLCRVVQQVMEVVQVPLAIDTANPKALEAALALYEGKALINSTNGEEKTLAAVLPIAKEHGAALIGLCMDDGGIPSSAQDRLAVADKIINRASALGIPLEDIVIDPLAMTMGADHNAGRVTLQAMELIVAEFGVNITLGASNVSFGLPDRKYINATFMAMAIQAGLTCPITNPLVPEIQTAVLAADLAMGKDRYGMNWIKGYRKRTK